VFYKARIGSQKPGTKIKRCWNWACTLKRPPVRLSVQGPVATSGCTLGARLSVQSQFCTGTFGFFPFFIQNPQFWSPNTQICFQSLFTGIWTQKGFQKHIKHEIKCYFNTIHQFNSFLQNPQQQLNSSTTTSAIIHTQAKIWDYQQQSTTTTTYNHVFNHNSTISCHNPSIEHNSSIIHIHISWTCKFIINHSIINKLTYPNISLTLEYEFQQVGSW